jgi:type II secretory pathway pseudopilin PulG
MKRHAAFTLGELMIAIMIIAILSISMVVNFSRSEQKAIFDDYRAQILAVMQQARGLSLSNILVEESTREETDYYVLELKTDGITLTAWGVDGSDVDIVDFDFEEGYEFTTDTYIYYFPPFGDICFTNDPTCSGGTTGKTFTFQSTDGNYSQRYAFTIYGGYPEEL